jgi:hypothetical protein
MSESAPTVFSSAGLGGGEGILIILLVGSSLRETGATSLQFPPSRLASESELCTGTIPDGHEATNSSAESTFFDSKLGFFLEFGTSVHAAWEDVEVVTEVGSGGDGRTGGGEVGNGGRGGGGTTEGTW